MRNPSDLLADLFEKAACSIDERGLSYGEFQNKEGAPCLWGAINIAMYGDPFQCTKASAFVLQALKPFCGGEHPVDWSNFYGRRKAEEVSALLRTARDAVREGKVDIDVNLFMAVMGGFDGK